MFGKEYKDSGLKNVNITKKNYKSPIIMDMGIIWRFFSWMENNYSMSH